MQGNPFTITPEAQSSTLLSDSWQRSQRYGLQPTSDEFPRLRGGELADVLESNRSLQRLAQPVATPLAAIGSDSFRCQRSGAPNLRQ